MYYGPEFVAQVLRDWLEEMGVQTAYIEPGSPWENGFCESFNGTLRDELLNGEIFYNLEEAKVLTKQWKDQMTKGNPFRDNQVRPHSSLGYRPPAPQVMLPRITQIQPGYMQ
jgi:transposase InsO family protein